MPYPNEPPIRIPDDVLTTISLDQLRELMENLNAESGSESQSKPDGK